MQYRQPLGRTNGSGDSVIPSNHSPESERIGGYTEGPGRFRTLNGVAGCLGTVSAGPWVMAPGFVRCTALQLYPGFCGT